MTPQHRKFWISSFFWSLIILSTVPFYVLDAIETNSIWYIFSALGSTSLWAIGQAVLYKQYYVGVKPRYPLGVADQDDIYFPRFNIPRPLYLDERKRRERDEKMKKIARQERSELDQ